MADGFSLLNPHLTMPVFVIPLDWYSGFMALSNICQRAVCMLCYVSSSSLPACHLLSSGF